MSASRPTAGLAVLEEVLVLRELAASINPLAMCEDILALAAKGRAAMQLTDEVLGSGIVEMVALCRAADPAATETMRALLLRFHEVQNRWPPYNSAHEGLGVLLEEVEELKDIVFQRQGARDPERMRQECLDIAVVALRFISSICDAGRVRR